MQRKRKIQLTERSFQAIGRTRLGMPDQLNFRNSSIKREESQLIYTDVLKLAENCLQQ